MSLTNTATTLMDMLPLATNTGATLAESDAIGNSASGAWFLISIGGLLLMASITVMFVKVSRDLGVERNPKRSA